MIFLCNIKIFLVKIKEKKHLHILSFLILFFVLLFIFWLVTKSIDLSKPYSVLSSQILNSQGISNEVFYNGANYGLTIGEMQINILDVCTGLFELCVFLALIFATLIVSFKHKLIGAVILIVLFFYFNLARILAMVWLLQNVNIYVVDILHTILFKIGFFLFFVLFYYIWLTLYKGDIDAKLQC